MHGSRLYYTDCYARSFDATVCGASEDRRSIYLDRTLFYPTSGGQPDDTGRVAGIPVIEVAEEEDGRIVHRLAAALPAETDKVHGEIDWARRYDHMQQHTGQHLLSAVLVDLFGIQTLSFHMSAEFSTVELNAPAITPEQIDQTEHRVAELVGKALPVHISFESADVVQGLRKPTEREGEIRLIEIEGVDRSACGGTHLRSTAEIGLLQIRDQEKVRGHARIAFVCGSRALARTKADFRLITALVRESGTSPDHLPAWLLKQRARLTEAEKEHQRLAEELASVQAAEYYRTTQPDVHGLRKIVRSVPRLDDFARGFATAFTRYPNAVILLTSTESPAVMLAASDDSGWNAGQRLREALGNVGGRGGGSTRLAQGNFEPEKLGQLQAALGFTPPLSEP